MWVRFRSVLPVLVAGGLLLALSGPALAHRDAERLSSGPAPTVRCSPMTATGRPAGWMVGVGPGSLHTMQDKTVLALPVLVRNQTGKAQTVRFDQQWKLRDVPSGKYFPLVASTPSLTLQPGEQGCVLLYYSALAGAGTSPCPFLNGGLFFYPVAGGHPSYGFWLQWPCKHEAGSQESGKNPGTKRDRERGGLHPWVQFEGKQSKHGQHS